MTQCLTRGSNSFKLLGERPQYHSSLVLFLESSPAFIDADKKLVHDSASLSLF